MSLRYEAACAAPPSAAWELLSRPDSWSRWAPHVRSAVGLGSPRVREGASGFVLLLGVLPVPARITQVRDGRSWTWRVGLSGIVQMSHVVVASGRRCVLVVEVDAPGPAETAIGASYGRLIPALLGRLARLAEESAFDPASES